MPPGSTATPFLTSGLAIMHDPRIERLHRIMQECKDMINPDMPQTFEEGERQFTAALAEFRRRRRLECG